MVVGKEFVGSLYMLVFSYSYIIRKIIFDFIYKNREIITGKVLDFGCGEKPYKKLFIYDEYIGIDFEKTGHDNLKNDIDCYWDGEKIPYADGYFDSILLTEVIEHIFNIDTVLAECKRVLKKGGHILITCPFIYPEHETPYDYARYTEYALRSLFTKNGLTVINYEKGGTGAQAILMLVNISIGDFFQKYRYRITRAVYIPFCCFLNIICLGCGKLFPSNKRLYISNLCIIKND